MLEHWMNRREREGDDRPAPTAAGARLWDMLCNHFFKLLWANFLCVLCCIPVITIPASLCGLFAVIQQYYRKGYGDVNDTFFKEFRQNFLVRILFVVLILVIPAVGLALGSLVSSRTALIFCAICTAFALVVLGWLFPQMALLSLRPAHALKNAVLLTALESKRDLLLILVWVVFGGSLLVFWPISMIALFILIPLLPACFIHMITEPVLESRIIRKEQSEIE